MEFIIKQVKNGISIENKVLIDDEDYEKIKQYSWHITNGYASRGKYRSPGRQSTIYLHNQLSNCPKDKVTDHINGNILDNRKSNLRVCSIAENNRAKSINKKVNISGYKGVFWEISCRRWRAQITFNDKRIHIGVFKNKIDAAIAYDKKAIELFKEFANLNFKSQEEIFNAYLKHAKNITTSYKKDLAPSEVFGECVPICGGDYSQPAPQSTADMLQAYAKYLPSVLQATAGQELPLAQAQEQATAATQPAYNALNLEQLKQYGVPVAQVGQDIQKSNALAGAETNVAQLTGPGSDAAKAALAVNKTTNSDYYAAQDAASSGAARAVNAVNLSGLSPGEAASVERANNQNLSGTGNLGLNNNSNIIANAMNFGGAFNSKVGLLNNAVNTATNAANSAAGNGGFNGVNIALGQPNMGTGTNFGTGTYSASNAGTGAGVAGNLFGFGSNVLGAANSSNNALIGANAQTGAAQIGANSPAAYLGAVCCFIFLEAFHGKIPWYVRHGRDRYYKLNHNIATGYRRMALWLVPLMQRNSLMRMLVWKLIVNPITQHLGNITGHKQKVRHKMTTHFWLKVWAILGKNKNENDYMMEWKYGI